MAFELFTIELPAGRDELERLNRFLAMNRVVSTQRQTVTRDGSYLRYMDDMLVFGTREDLGELKFSAGGFLQERLGLDIKHGGSLQPVTHGMEFLGYRVFPNRLLLNRRSRERFRRRIRELDCRLASGDCSELEYQRKVTALTAFVRHADSYNFRGQVCMN